MFEKGERLSPPDKILGGVVVAVATIKKAEKALFKIDEFLEVGDEILDFYESVTGGAYVIVTRSHPYLGKHKLDTDGRNPYVFTPLSAKAIEVIKSGHKFRLYEAYTGIDLGLSYDCKQLATYENRIYYTQGSNLIELTFWEQSTKLLPQVTIVGQVMENASKLYSGVCIQNLLGTWYTSILAEAGKCFQMRMKELDGYTVIEAKFLKPILMIVLSKAGKYYRAVAKFNETYSEYKFEVREIDTYAGLNFIVLPNGVAICLNEEDKIELFSTKWDVSQSRVLEDKNVCDVQLFSCGGRALFAKANKLYRFSLQE
jgi:hypothetical protein